MKRIAAAIAVAAALGIASAAAVPASASSLPKIQTNGFGNWHTAWRIRPSRIVFGTNYFIKDLHYRHYNQHSAYARGRLVIDRCRPDCAQGGHFVNAGGSFYDVLNHSGPGRNFGYLKLTWDNGHRSRLFWIDGRGQWMWPGT
jgi:hypothetical protein